MRASQIEAFLQTELSQGRNTISLTLVLRVCRAYLEVKIWLGDGGRLSEYDRIACAKVPPRYFGEPHSAGCQTSCLEGVNQREGA